MATFFKVITTYTIEETIETRGFLQSLGYTTRTIDSADYTRIYYWTEGQHTMLKEEK